MGEKCLKCEMYIQTERVAIVGAQAADPDGWVIPGSTWTVYAEEIVKGQQDDIARLQSIVDRLPKTADGVIVLPGTRVYFKSDNLWTLEIGCLVDSVEIEEGYTGVTTQDYGLLGPDPTPLSPATSKGEPRPSMSLPDMIYSTREAAEVK